MARWRWTGLVVAAGLTLAGCTTTAPPGDATDLMGGVKARTVTTRPMDTATATGLADFAIGLLRHEATGPDNALVSPLSAELALAMAANGADGETLAQMERVLAGGTSIADLNAILPAYAKSLPNTSAATFHVANSIWCSNRKGVAIVPSFLQTNADYYGAGVFSVPFDDGTVQAANAWVDKHTDGMIPKIVNEFDPATVVFLLNALAFDAAWAAPYPKETLHDGTFTSASGQAQTAHFMGSEEFTYLDDGLATGFAKPYQGDTYRFVALLPNEGVTMTDYLASLSGAGWLRTLASAQQGMVVASLPQFSNESSMRLNDTLAALGMPDAFDAATADLSRMGTDNGQPLYIGEVRQKTFIDVTPLGTRAGAATSVEAKAGAAQPETTVILDRPFVYGIVDTASNLPLFLGVVNSVG